VSQLSDHAEPGGKMAFTTKSDHSEFQAVRLEERVIDVKNIWKKFGDEAAVREATFHVPQGVIFGFIGPSGSGKTTMVRLLTGIYQPSEGEVTVLGRHPNDFTRGIRSRIGYMPQLFVLYPNLTVWENLNFAASIYGMSLFRRRGRLREVLDFVELYEHRGKLARDTSGGMQRRLSLAATLVHEPDLIFLDEPTAGIDPVLRRKFWDHFKLLQKDGTTLFITTQYVNEASYCDLVGVMANGRLITVDTPDGLRQRAFGGEMVDIRTKKIFDYRFEHMLDELPFVRGPVIRTGENSVRIVVEDAGTAMPDLMEWSGRQNIEVDSIEEYLPPFDDVFVELVEREEEDG
jgi:ABC-2 type transport system ATP-binding protein